MMPGFSNRKNKSNLYQQSRDNNGFSEQQHINDSYCNKQLGIKTPKNNNSNSDRIGFNKGVEEFKATSLTTKRDNDWNSEKTSQQPILHLESSRESVEHPPNEDIFEAASIFQSPSLQSQPQHLPRIQKKVVRLKKEIGFLSGVAINVGVMIGTGIFVSPMSVIKNTQSIGLSLVVWAVCGIFSLFGALCYAELGTTFSASGGEYTYIRVAFGKVPSFLYVWMCLLVLTTAGKAANALAFSEYAIGPIFAMYGHGETPRVITKIMAVCLVSLYKKKKIGSIFIQLSPRYFWKTLGADLIFNIIFICTALAINMWSLTYIALLVFINCRKVRLATRIQTLFTFCKLFALVVIIIVGLYKMAKGNYKRFSPTKSFANSNFRPGNIALASYSSLYAYSGWNSLNYITEEVVDSYKTLPRTLFCSITLVTVIYVLTNMAYMSVLDPIEIINSKAVAMTFIERSIGYSYSIAISVFVAISIFGGLNGSILVSSRIFFASARNGQFPILFSMINIKNLTPITSLFFIGLVTCMFSVVSSIMNLINYHSFTDAFFSFLTILALLYMRYKKPQLERPFKVNIIIPIVFAIICLFLLTFPFSREPIVCGIATCMILSGIPVYYFFTHLSKVPCFKQINGIVVRFCQRILYCAKEDADTD